MKKFKLPLSHNVILSFFFCHPERSEGSSEQSERMEMLTSFARFFVATLLRMTKQSFSLFLFLGIAFFWISPALAQETSIISSEPYNIIKGISDVCLNNGECTLCDILLVGIRLTRFLLGLSGAVALLLLVIAGLYLLVSGGSQELIGKAKTIIKNVVWGFVFVFLSWQIINLILLLFLKPNNNAFTKGNIVATVSSGQIWSEITCKGWTKTTYTQTTNTTE